MVFAPPFNRICYKVDTTTNEYSDTIMGVTSSLTCHFREIDLLDRFSHDQEYSSDAMVWFPTGTDIALGDTILFDNKYYEIQKLTNAVRLGYDAIEFIKCEVKYLKPGVS